MHYILLKKLGEPDLEFLSELEGRAHWLNQGQYTLHLGMPGGPTYHVTRKILISNALDSGWCDYGTGARIIGPSERLVIENCSPETATALKLRYLDSFQPIEIVE